MCDGAAARAGAVAASRFARHPVLAARAVMERTPHVLLAGPGPDWLDAVGLERVDPSWFVTPARMAALRAGTSDPTAPAVPAGLTEPRVGHGTVGAVARDAAGRLAAATSTGGVTGQWAGRIGDTPVVGAGTWADERVAVSGTGIGEYFLRAALAHDVAARVRWTGAGLADAVRDAVADDLVVPGGDGGVIAAASDGTLVLAYCSQAMLRGPPRSRRAGRRRLTRARLRPPLGVTWQPRRPAPHASAITTAAAIPASCEIERWNRATPSASARALTVPTTCSSGGRPPEAGTHASCHRIPPGEASALATASLTANRAASEAGGSSRSTSVNSRCRRAGVRSSAWTNRATSTTSIPTPTITARQSNPRTSRSASSTAARSAADRRPAKAPSRTSGSTACVCSRRTRVRPPSTTTSGRNPAGPRDVDVGATSQVDRRRSSDWTTTAYRTPCCS